MFINFDSPLEIPSVKISTLSKQIKLGKKDGESRMKKKKKFAPIRKF